MASLNLSTNGASIRSSYTSVLNSNSIGGSPTSGVWCLLSVSAPLVNAFQGDSGGKESVLKVQDTGEGELSDLIDDFSEGRIQFAFVKVKDPNTTLPKYVLIGWCGEGVPERTKGYFTSHLAAVSKALHGYHVQITARSDRDLTPEGIVQKVADASGAKYSAGSALPSSSSGPAPPVATKPVFQPTRSGAGSSFNPLASRSRAPQRDDNVDDDGWGADAPPVTRSEIEKVAPAYKPTKVNMAELTKQTQEPSRFNGGSRSIDLDNSDVVRGGYQPIGKVDIAAIRAQAKEKADDRPTIVKGAYEPVGKVDIAAIRAKAQKPAEEAVPKPTPSSTGDDDAPKSLADRSAAFTQSDRITSLPKPKVANRFGSTTSSFAGTKAPTPGQFGLQSAPANVVPPPVGAASRTFADEGGKTPAQIWAEKKARERSLSGAADTAPPTVTSPIVNQSSGGGEWKSGYTGKSWAPVGTNATGRSGAGSIGQQRTGEQDDEEEETPASPVGGIGAIRDRFKGAAPMGAPGSAPSIARNTSGDAPPPPVPSATRPTGGVAMPGLPSRHVDEEESSGPNIPPPPVVPRSPTPEAEYERDESPVRIAIPVSRGKAPSALEAPEERDPVPPMPVKHIEENLPNEDDLTEEPAGHDPARGAGAAVAANTFGHREPETSGGLRAIAVYDYEKAEDNEIDFQEGEYITEIEQVDPDWWQGKNARGEVGLFPSNYVELAEEEEAAAPAASLPPPPAPVAAAVPSAPRKSAGPTATALYDYEAAEDNELSFGEGDQITDLEYPDEDWWHGSSGGRSGLFPSNYVELNK